MSGKIYSAMAYSAAGHEFEAAQSTIYIKQGNSKRHTKPGGQKCGQSSQGLSSGSSPGAVNLQTATTPNKENGLNLIFQSEKLH